MPILGQSARGSNCTHACIQLRCCPESNASTRVMRCRTYSAGYHPNGCGFRFPAWFFSVSLKITLHRWRADTVSLLNGGTWVTRSIWRRTDAETQCKKQGRAPNREPIVVYFLWVSTTDRVLWSLEGGSNTQHAWNQQSSEGLFCSAMNGAPSKVHRTS